MNTRHQQSCLKRKYRNWHKIFFKKVVAKLLTKYKNEKNLKKLLTTVEFYSIISTVDTVRWSSG